MTEHALIEDEQLVEKAVKRHKQWRDGLSKEQFFSGVFGVSDQPC